MNMSLLSIKSFLLMQRVSGLLQADSPQTLQSFNALQPLQPFDFGSFACLVNKIILSFLKWPPFDLV